MDPTIVGQRNKPGFSEDRRKPHNSHALFSFNNTLKITYYVSFHSAITVVVVVYYYAELVLSAVTKGHITGIKMMYRVLEES